MIELALRLLDASFRKSTVVLLGIGARRLVARSSGFRVAWQRMRFWMVDEGTAIDPRWDKRKEAFLIRADWNDYWQYQTLFELWVFDSYGRLWNVGHVKIIELGMHKRIPTRSLTEAYAPPVYVQPALVNGFTALDDRFISLGRLATYYETIAALDEDARLSLLRSLNDVADSPELLQPHALSPEVKDSLLRDVDERTRERFTSILRGTVKRTEFAFGYGFEDTGPTLDFEVDPTSMPPTNVHVLIGRNGVGKTSLLQRIARSLISPSSDPFLAGVFPLRSDGGARFANLVAVTFSAFDRFPVPEISQASISYHYVGLQRGFTQIPHAIVPPKHPGELGADFVTSARTCLMSARSERWLAALRILESDPLFEAEGVAALVDDPNDDWDSQALNLFDKLSSGHKIVLLMVTRLVETVEDRTLVLLDEPEAHLHPPLLGAFVRCLSDLLHVRNGVAIVATHSPVVLQEVTRSCVWVLDRSGGQITANRPDIETFGENVGVLTREVFGLEVTRSGFHRLVSGRARSEGYEATVAAFSNQLGSEARSIARALALHAPKKA